MCCEITIHVRQYYLHLVKLHRWNVFAWEPIFDFWPFNVFIVFGCRGTSRGLLKGSSRSVSLNGAAEGMMAQVLPYMNRAFSISLTIQINLQTQASHIRKVWAGEKNGEGGGAPTPPYREKFQNSLRRIFFLRGNCSAGHRTSVGRLV